MDLPFIAFFKKYLAARYAYLLDDLNGYLKSKECNWSLSES